LTIALDATYSTDEHLSGVGLYSHEILFGMAAAHPEIALSFLLSAASLPARAAGGIAAERPRRLILEPFSPRGADLFHGLNQRLPRIRMRRSVATFHDLFVISGEYSSAEFRARFTEQARDAAERADAIIAVSEFTRGQVISLLGVAPSRVHVVHHGVRRWIFRQWSGRE
jgi:glycosyltransferase involved in cell wall biosynthesis